MVSGLFLMTGGGVAFFREADTKRARRYPTLSRARPVCPQATEKKREGRFFPPSELISLFLTTDFLSLFVLSSWSFHFNLIYIFHIHMRFICIQYSSSFLPLISSLTSSEFPFLLSPYLVLERTTYSYRCRFAFVVMLYE